MLAVAAVAGAAPHPAGLCPAGRAHNDPGAQTLPVAPDDPPPDRQPVIATLGLVPEQHRPAAVHVDEQVRVAVPVYVSHGKTPCYSRALEVVPCFLADIPESARLR